MNSCKNCNEPISGNYCSNCGEPAKPQKIDRHYVMQEIANVLFTHSGLLFTLKRLLTSPGESVRYYITESRSRYVKPITFVVITALIYTLVSHFFYIDTKIFSLQPDMEVSAFTYFRNWMIDYHGYANMIIGFLIAFWVKVFFRKLGYNLFEIFILMCFIIGVQSCFTSLIFIIHGLTHLRLLPIAMLFALIYNTWAIGQFFDRKKVTSYIKAFLSYVLGIVTFAISVTFVITLLSL